MIRFFLLLLSSLLLVSPAWAAASCTVTKSGGGGEESYILVLTFTSSSSATEVACIGVPVIGTMGALKFKLESGAGTQLTPVVGTSPSFVASTMNYVGTVTSPGAFINEQIRTTYWSKQGILYVRPVPNSGTSNHTINGTIIIAGGVE